MSLSSYTIERISRDHQEEFLQEAKEIQLLAAHGGSNPQKLKQLIYKFGSFLVWIGDKIRHRYGTTPQQLHRNCPSC